MSGRFDARVALGLVAAGAVGVLAVWAWRAETAPPGSPPSGASGGPTANQSSAVGFDIRYLDQHGQLRNLPASEFPR